MIAQGSEFPLRKPPGFHYDFFLLGITTFIAGLLGVPAPNGLIPQAPIHTTSLLVMGRRAKQDDLESKQPTVLDPVTDAGEVERDKEDDGGKLPELDPSPARHEVPIAVVEQRVSNLAQGSMCLVLLTGPFLHVLNLIPRGVLAGLLLVSLISCAGVLTNEEFCAFLQLVHGVGCITRERRHSQDSISLQRSPPYATD